MYEDQMDIAFAGMKADSGDDRVETFPVGASNLPFGVVCGTDANGKLVAGGGTKVRGVTVHSHAVQTDPDPSVTPGYQKTDAASVMTRGLIWCAVAAGKAVNQDAPVKYEADGTVGSDAGTDLNNAVFRSGKVETENYGDIALVELHNPFVDRFGEGGS